MSDKLQKLGSPSAIKKSFTDSYTDNCPAGKTIGTQSPSGTVRKGVDVEKLIAIDNGALRIQPLSTPGWGRQGIAYGPYTRANGLAFAVFLVNGHSTSQTGDIGDSLVRRLLRWTLGSRTGSPVQQMLGWVRSKQKNRLLRRLLYWVQNTPKRPQSTCIDENLALGWFKSEVPSDPLTEGNAFIIHATGPENGELWTRVGANLLSAFKGLQNVQVYYIVILREKGAAYYAASVPNAHGLVAYPSMRAIAIDPFNEETTLYAGLYQSVLGQVGFWVDTRVYAAHVELIPEIATWYGTAHAADDLIGDGLLDGSQAEIGGGWRVYQGSYQLTAKGIRPKEIDTIAVLDPGTPSGLVHAIVETPANVSTLSLLWRVRDENNFWSFLMGGDKCQLQIKEDGIWTSVAVSHEWCLQPNTIHSVQILDDGETFSLYLNGKLVFNTWFTDTRLQNSTGIGIGTFEVYSDLYFRTFEAHPRSIPIPTALNLGSPWLADGKEIVVADDFTGAVREVSGTITSVGGKVWRKEIGAGTIELTGSGNAKVRASVQNPNPRRTAYTVAWDNPDFADVQVEITPSGTERGQGERGRGGLIFWQDTDNYIIINNWLDDCYEGASISSFFYLNGCEDLYDAVWTNVGSRIYWGIPHKLRIVFDGMNYTAFINEEPVLYRALTDVYPDAKRFAINRVGIVANWEWGNDTGTVFNNFVAKV